VGTVKFSLYDRFGGNDAITAVVRAVVDRQLEDDRINQKFGRTNVDRVIKELVVQICQVTGGPHKYTGRNMTAAHHNMGVTNGESEVTPAAAEQMNRALWIAASVLAAVLLGAAINKLVLPKDKLAAFPGGGWVEDFSPGALKAISTVEILGAAGLVLPGALGIAPVLVPTAATGTALLFAGAVITRLRRGEKLTIAVDMTYLAMAVFVAWGRFGPSPHARGRARPIQELDGS
jgi:truncated hemoglobin YjbI